MLISILKWVHLLWLIVSLGAKPNKHWEEFTGGHSVSYPHIPTLVHTGRKCPPMLLNFCKCHEGASTPPLDHLEWEWSVGDPDITLAGSHLIRGVSWAQEQKKFELFLSLIYTDKVRLRGDWSSNILSFFSAVLLQETSLLETGWVHGCEFCLCRKDLISAGVSLVFSQPLCRFGMRWETWGLSHLFKHSSPKILHLVCDYVVQLFVCLYSLLVKVVAGGAQQNSTVFHMEMNLSYSSRFWWNTIIFQSDKQLTLLFQIQYFLIIVP